MSSSHVESAVYNFSLSFYFLPFELQLRSEKKNKSLVTATGQHKIRGSAVTSMYCTHKNGPD